MGLCPETGGLTVKTAKGIMYGVLGGIVVYSLVLAWLRSGI